MVGKKLFYLLAMLNELFNFEVNIHLSNKHFLIVRIIDA